MLASTDDSGPAGNRTTGRRYRLTGLGLVALGVAAAVGAAVAPSATLRDLLVAFAGAGLFGGVLAYWIRPGATGDVDPPARVQAALAATGDALARDFALGDRRVYVPADAAPDGFAPAYLALPGDGESAPTARRPILGADAPDERGDAPESDGTAVPGSGIAVYPTGAALFDAYEAVATEDLPAEPVELGDQLATGAVAGLELAGTVDPTVDAPAGTVTATVRDPAFGPVTRFDHPVASFLGVGFALGLETPVTVETRRVDAGYRVVCEWDPDAVDVTPGSTGGRADR